MITTVRTLPLANKVRNKITMAKARRANKIPKSTLVSRVKFRRSSYSQSGEDLIIKNIFGERGIAKPTYIDIGAHDPHYLNNTALFYYSGCSGINIEPDPELFKRFLRSRKRDTNLNIGIAEKAGRLDLHIMSSPTLNTFSEKEAKSYVRKGYHIIGKKKIKVANINSIIKKYCKGIAPSLLTVDIEGLDYDVLKTVNYSVFSPEVVCVETIGFTTDGSGKKDNRISNLLQKNGYSIYADTKINTIFAKNR